MPISSDDNAKRFQEVFEVERGEIRERRRQAQKTPVLEGTVSPELPKDLVGLALSGGGIRSATFCLGVLQGLNELKLLHIFDYLSTVSGGGFVGGWWSAWLSRNDCDDGNIFPQAERIEPERSDQYVLLGSHSVNTVEAATQPEVGKKGSEADAKSLATPSTTSANKPGIPVAATIKPRLSEGSINAGRDPIHHLRLFANYLTPRRGALSLDTWRAVAVITRNLALTWLVLVPLLLAAALLGQLYFVIFTPENFPHPSMKTTVSVEEKGQPANAESSTPQKREEIANEQAKDLGHSFLHQVSNAKTLKLRAWVAFYPVGGLALLMALVVLGWTLKIQSGPLLLTISRLIVFGVVMTAVVNEDWGLLLVGSLILLFPVVMLIWGLVQVRRIGRSAVVAELRSPGSFADRLTRAGVSLYDYIVSVFSRRDEAKLARRARRQWRTEVYLNKMTRLQASLLVFFVVLAGVLVLSGFGHEFVEYVFYKKPEGSPFERFVVYLEKSVSVSALFAAVAGMIYTGAKAAPTGGGDQRGAGKASPTSRLIFAISPPLVLIVLGVLAAWFAHGLLWLTFAKPDLVDGLKIITLTGIIFAFISAAYEMQWGRIPSWIAYWIAWPLLGLLLIFGGPIVMALIPQVTYYAGQSSPNRFWALILAAVVGGLGVFNFLVSRIMDRKQLKGEGYRITFYLLIAVILFLSLGVAAIVAYLTHQAMGDLGAPPNAELMESSVKALFRCGLLFVFISFARFLGRRRNHASFWLVSALYVVLTTLLITSLFPARDVHPTIYLVYSAVLLTTTTLAFVATLGWMADPNALSIHSFYKGRLVRAYLGASNKNRGRSTKEITESVAGDDLLLTQLRNCQRGAPYHLVNTTLNLVGGRDLATAQRSSAMFVLSKHFCGSTRTGYRETKDYMHSDFSLGTAVAVSGAAVSPNMGSVKTTASLAMLMTLLNVRLGYWAPTPNKDRWRSAQARLWPYYTLREFLSETNDLSSYCYLTDGGHFDNTGMYSLAERGCRCIVIADCSADPEPCFADLGNAVRRCRIDFDAEIDLDVAPLMGKGKDDQYPRQHSIVGRIIYSEAHFESLGWKNAPLNERTGVILYIKPALLKDDQGLTVDVRQYSLENSAFPQQTTANQWFDEAQFESYRQLGEHSVKMAFANLEIDEEVYQRAKEKQEKDQALLAEDRLMIETKEARDNIAQQQSSAGDTLKLFEALYQQKPGKELSLAQRVTLTGRTPEGDEQTLTLWESHHA